MLIPNEHENVSQNVDYTEVENEEMRDEERKIEAKLPPTQHAITELQRS